MGSSFQGKRIKFALVICELGQKKKVDNKAYIVLFLLLLLFRA